MNGLLWLFQIRIQSKGKMLVYVRPEHSGGSSQLICSWKNQRSLRDADLFGGGRGQYIQLHLSIPVMLKQKQMNIVYVLYAFMLYLRL